MRARNTRGNLPQTPPGAPPETSQLVPSEVGLHVEDRNALDHLFSATYEELRRLASSVRRGDPSATLNPTALVNEAWMKMAKSPEIAPTSRLHFKRIAALQAGIAAWRWSPERPYRCIRPRRTQGDDIGSGPQGQGGTLALGGRDRRHRRTEDHGAQSGYKLTSVERESAICHEVDADHFPLDMSSCQGA